MTTIFQRFARITNTPFLIGFYRGFDPEWIFWMLNWYSLLSLLFLVCISISLIILGLRKMRKIFITGIILLLGIIMGVLLDFLNMGALVPACLYVGMPFVTRQIRVNLNLNRPHNIS